MSDLEVSPAIFATFPEEVHIIDVRTPEEFWGPEGHIQDALLASLGPALLSFLEGAPKEEYYLFACAHGKRSLQATMMAQEKGFSNVLSLQGGLCAWKNAGFSVVFEKQKIS